MGSTWFESPETDGLLAMLVNAFSLPFSFLVESKVQ
jgi:hypothetical protein